MPTTTTTTPTALFRFEGGTLKEFVEQLTEFQKEFEKKYPGVECVTINSVEEEEDKPQHNICCGCGKYKNTGAICDCGCSHREKCVKCLEMEDDPDWEDWWEEEEDE